jgi:hypothetical protein
VEKMSIRYYPGIESDFEGVVGNHPLIIFGDLHFSLLDINRGTTWQDVLGRSFPESLKGEQGNIPLKQVK